MMLLKDLIDTVTKLPPVLIDIIWQYDDYTPITTIIVNKYFKQFLTQSLIRALHLPQVIADANYNIERAVQRIASNKDSKQAWVNNPQIFKQALIFALDLGYSDESCSFSLLIPVIKGMIGLVSDIHYTDVSQSMYNHADDIYFEALIRFASGLPLTFQDNTK